MFMERFSVHLLFICITICASFVRANNSCAQLFRKDAHSGVIGKLVAVSAETEGTTGGAWYKDEAETKWFVKTDVHFAELQTSAEVISSQIYTHFGYQTPLTIKFKVNGVFYSASRDIGQNHTFVEFDHKHTS